MIGFVGAVKKKRAQRKKKSPRPKRKTYKWPDVCPGDIEEDMNNNDSDLRPLQPSSFQVPTVMKSVASPRVRLITSPLLSEIKLEVRNLFFDHHI